jgi:Tol biopolymer transport system component
VAGTDSVRHESAVTQTGRPKWKSWAFAGGGLALLALASLLYLQSRPLPPPKVSGYVPVTHDGSPKGLVGTDGARLFFNEYLASGRFIAQVSSSGGEVALVSTPAPTMSLLGVSPDGATLLVADEVGQTAFQGSLWAVPVLGGSPRRLGEAIGQASAWSPDGQRIVYAEGNDLFLAKSDGSELHKLVSAPDRIQYPAWSPDGSVIRFNTGNLTYTGSLYQVSVNGTDLRLLLPGWHAPPNESFGRWTADGKYFVFKSGTNIWALAEKGSLFGRADRQPVQLTSGPMTFYTPLPSKDGKKLFVVGALARGELTRYDTKSAAFVPFLSGISADSVSFSKDGQWVAYVSFPEGTLWKSKLDGSQRIQLTYPPLTAVLPSWSPDGQQIIFYGMLNRQKAKLYMVSSDGVTLGEMIPEDTEEEFDPTWSPDGTRIAFGGAPSDPALTVRILDVQTHQISTLPDSKGLFSPRWSPDGRNLVAMPFNSRSLELFDFATQKWEEIAKISMGFPNWSKNGDYVYFLHEENQPSVMRVRIRDRKVERVADLKNFRQTGYWVVWLGMAPDDSPLLLRDTGTEEIYALDWQAP